MAIGNYCNICTKISLSQLLRGRFFSAFGSIIILTCVGSSYIFGLYSNSIKSSLGYDQTTLNTISFFKDLGAYIAVHIGLLMEVCPPWAILFLGAIVNFVGYFMIWLYATHMIAHPSVWQMCLFIYIGASSGCYAHNAGVVTSVNNFPENRGQVLGILKGYIGLGGAIMTQLYHTLYGNDNNGVGVILIIACAPALALMLFAYSIRFCETSNRQVKRDKKFFNDIMCISLALAGFMMVMIIVQKNVEFTKRAYGVSFAVIVLLFFLPFLLVVREECVDWEVSSATNASSCVPELKIMTKTDVPSLAAQQSVREKRDSCFKDVFRPPPLGEDYSILQATFSIDMHIMMISTLCGIGGNLTTMDNLGQIGTSLGYQKNSISVYVSLVAIWQFLGRTLGGVFSDYLLDKFKWPRTAFLTVVLLLSCIGHLLIAFNAPYGLYVSSIVVGFCLGAQLTFLMTLVSELFGLKHYSTLNTYVALTAPLGSYIFNVRTAGHLYDKEGLRQLAAMGLTRKPGQTLNCNGVKCYQLTYIIITAATLFAALLSLIVVARTWRFYKGDIYKRFRAKNEVLQSTDEVITPNGENCFASKKY